MINLLWMANGSSKVGNKVVVIKELLDALSVAVRIEVPFEVVAKIRDAIVACVEEKAVDGLDLTTTQRIQIVLKLPYFQ